MGKESGVGIAAGQTDRLLLYGCDVLRDKFSLEESPELGIFSIFVFFWKISPQTGVLRLPWARMHILALKVLVN